MNRDEEGYALTTPEIASIFVVVVGAESVLLWRNLCLLFYFKMICYHAPVDWTKYSLISLYKPLMVIYFKLVSNIPEFESLLTNGWLNDWFNSADL
jgi:hypothetical protein